MKPHNFITTVTFEGCPLSVTAEHCWVCLHLHSTSLNAQLLATCSRPPQQNTKLSLSLPPSSSCVGVNDTDIVMAVATSPNCTQKMFAFSASCDWDLVTSRPTAGIMIICPGFFNQTEGEQLATMVHEAIHALVRTAAWDLLGQHHTLPLANHWHHTVANYV